MGFQRSNQPQVSLELNLVDIAMLLKEYNIIDSQRKTNSCAALLQHVGPFVINTDKELGQQALMDC